MIQSINKQKTKIDEKPLFSIKNQRLIYFIEINKLINTPDHDAKAKHQPVN